MMTKRDLFLYFIILTIRGMSSNREIGLIEII